MSPGNSAAVGEDAAVTSVDDCEETAPLDDRDGRAPDVETAIDRIDERAAAVRDRQVSRALAELDARGDLDPETRAAVEALAERLTERLLTTPRDGLRAAADADGTDDDAAAVALDLFGV